MNSDSDTEINNEILIKAIVFSNVLHCLETVKTYLEINNEILIKTILFSNALRCLETVKTYLEINNEVLIKTIVFSNALHCLETVKTYLSQQGTNDAVFSSLHKVNNRTLSNQE
ncbi:hypothetical protein TNCV_2781271 [Trichonephila clavipes]|nr:hypothetical protein TNCV_2781271 [Trichonephila clavipes]